MRNITFNLILTKKFTINTNEWLEIVTIKRVSQVLRIYILINIRIRVRTSLYIIYINKTILFQMTI